jgi:hypothetical protein
MSGGDGEVEGEAGSFVDHGGTRVTEKKKKRKEEKIATPTGSGQAEAQRRRGREQK